ncbi:MAG: hypothetical protein Q4F06_10755 [Eubacteriales bacterium]|nr:hypothetical protein [Eubacteriales bacterium]
MEKFWEKERRANGVRKKDLSGLDYISIPDECTDLESYPTLLSLTDNNFSCKRAYETICNLKEKKIVNLTGISNTDLKLNYGVANLPVLTEYDDNFTELVRSLQTLGHCLLEANDTQTAQIFLEFAVSIGSDIKQTYSDLALIFSKHGEKNKLDKLITYASTLNSINKDLIIQDLKQLQ